MNRKRLPRSLCSLFDIKIKASCKPVTSLSTLTRLADGFGSIELTLPGYHRTGTRDSPHVRFPRSCDSAIQVGLPAINHYYSLETYPESLACLSAFANCLAHLIPFLTVQDIFHAELILSHCNV